MGPAWYWMISGRLVQFTTPRANRLNQGKTRIVSSMFQISPPTKFGEYDYYVVLYHAAKIPEETLKPIFDEAQWRALTRVFAQAKGMEAHLKRNGFIQ